MFVEKFTRVECDPCGNVFSILTTLDDDRYEIEFCTSCGSSDIATYDEEAAEHEAE